MAQVTGQRSPTTPTLDRDHATWVVYGLLTLFTYLQTALGPVVPFVRARLGLNFTVASLHFAAFAAGVVLVGLVSERAVRRFGRRATLWGGMGGMVLGGVVLAASPSIFGTIAGALAMGWFGVLSVATSQAFLTDHHGSGRAAALAESSVAASIAAVGAQVAVGGFAASGRGWWLGLLLSVPLFVVLYSLFRGVEIPAATVEPPRDGAGAKLPTAYWLAWTVFFLLIAVEWTLAFWGTEFLASAVGLGQVTAATAMGIFFAALAVGRFVGARLALRFDVAPLLLAALLIAAVAFPVFWLAASPPVSLAALFVAGLGIANFYPFSVAAAAAAAPHLVDRATARLQIGGGAAVLIAPVIVGALADRIGFRWGIGIVEPLLLLGIGATLLAARSARDNRAPPTRSPEWQ